MSWVYRSFWLAMLGFGLAAPAAAQQAGIASVAVGDPLSRSPQQVEHVLLIGVDVFAGERISTRSDDRAHLVFLDGSALTVGPNADLTIDRFNYDPHTRQGDLAITVSRGAFRYVGGAISKTKDVLVQTPSATIGIRGGILTAAIGADGSTTVGFLYGRSAHVTNRFGAAAAYRAGSQISVPANGPPSSPVALPASAIESLLAKVDLSPGIPRATGNQQADNAGLNGFNSQPGASRPGTGQQAFINFMNGSAQQSANVVNQANVLIAPSQATPLSVSSPSAAPVRGITPAISAGAPIVPSVAAPPIKAPVPTAAPPAAPPSSGAIFTLSGGSIITRLVGAGGSTVVFLSAPGPGH